MPKYDDNVELVVPLRLNKEEQIQLYDNSIERVVKSAIKCAEFTARNARSDQFVEYSSCQADLEDLRVLLTRLWDSARNSLFVLDNKR